MLLTILALHVYHEDDTDAWSKEANCFVFYASEIVRSAVKFDPALQTTTHINYKMLGRDFIVIGKCFVLYLRGWFALAAIPLGSPKSKTGTKNNYINIADSVGIS